MKHDHVTCSIYWSIKLTEITISFSANNAASVKI